MEGIEEKRYLGTITGVTNTSDSYIITAQIPSVIDKITCYPEERCYDEPNIGDVIWVHDLDPLFHSYFTYKRITENTDKGMGEGAYVGMRNRGKSITFNDNYIQAGIYDNGDFNSDNDTPKCTSYVNISSGGQMTVQLEDDSIVNISGAKKVNIANDVVIRIGGSTTIEIEGERTDIVNHGNLNLEVGGTFSLNANKIDIGGREKLTINSSTAMTPFNILAACPYGGIHGTNSIGMHDILGFSTNKASELLSNYGLVTTEGDSDSSSTTSSTSNGFNIDQIYSDAASGNIENAGNYNLTT